MRRLPGDEIKHIEYEIFRKFDEICRDNDLPYLLAYGTCLGAIRHDGFIPWDDDIDVYMIREDYERFYEIARHLDGSFQVKCYRDHSVYHQYFKLVDTRTVCHESYIRPEYSIGLWIDIFPLDQIDTTTVRGKAALKKALVKNRWYQLLLQLAVGDPTSGTSQFARFFKKVTNPIAGLIDPFSVTSKIESNAESITKKSRADVSLPREKAQWINLSVDWCQYGHIYDGAVLFPGRIHQFESLKCPVPNRYEAYLEYCYGDWQALPPEDQRHPHFAEAYSLVD